MHLTLKGNPYLFSKKQEWQITGGPRIYLSHGTELSKRLESKFRVNGYKLTVEYATVRNSLVRTSWTTPRSRCEVLFRNAANRLTAVMNGTCLPGLSTCRTVLRCSQVALWKMTRTCKAPREQAWIELLDSVGHMPTEQVFDMPSIEEETHDKEVERVTPRD